ncbi:AAA family ATPase [Ornithinibacillus sp. 4-3]|uniref:Nuclease SbcCD subunit C n=1 Tax=Ornithinibacillus sp. 4-3 TaxID=3231488 RepID=A0AB39HT32_9BACI
MKPLRLTMTGFGPYKNTEIIDFTKLNENRLFVICGNTGAGKTTIFDGICFALYGSASGSDRENYMMLRSDFADDQVHTSVELFFEIHQRRFRVLRQLPHVKKGNKTKTGEKYEFYEIIDQEETPVVDRQIVSEINLKIEELIGLTEDQFKQIIMLPQGEFRKLLTSETENKEAILRRLFKTDGYQKINEKLRNKRAEVEKAYEREKAAIDTTINNISATLPVREESILFPSLAAEHVNVAQVLTGLEREISYYHQKIEEDKKAYQEALKLYNAKTQALFQAEALNERFGELDKKNTRLQQLQTELPHIQTKEKQLLTAERANQIEIYEKQAEEAANEVLGKQKALAEAKSNVEKVTEALKQAEIKLHEEEAKKDVRENIRTELDRLNQFLPVVQAMEVEKKALETYQKNAEETKKQLHQLEENWKKQSEIIQQNEKQIYQDEQIIIDLPEKMEKRSKLREHWNILTNLRKLKQTNMQIKKEKQEKDEAYQQVKRHYDLLEEKWLNGQASILANHLHNGDACPVCGSLTHPNKADHQEEFVSREQLESMRKQLNEVSNHLSEAAGQLKSNQTQIEQLQASIHEMGIQFQSLEKVISEVESAGKQLNEEIITLQKKQELLAENKQKLEKVKLEYRKLEQQKHLLEKDYYEQQNLYDRTHAVYEERIRQIPESFRVLATLEARIQQLQKQQRQLEQALEQAQANYQNQRDMLTNAHATLKHTETQLQDAKTREEKSITAFDEAITRAQFSSKAEYLEAKLPELACTQLKQEIEQFKQEKVTVERQVKELQESLHEKEKADLTVLSEEVQQWKEKYEEKLKTLQLSEKYFHEGTEIKERIEKTSTQVTALEARYGVITDLYDVLRGQNSKKISFERYLQIEYLEQIIEAANYRLQQLSNGQYFLLRSERQESHGRQSGLALDVYDNYTGQIRDVKTLSGGEKFNASLCLALGMSDVIQSFQGNVRIDTMFIDEGFGSLDEESLHKAIDALIDLQKSGRMIGVISHVQALKNSFSAVLEVKKSREGYSTTKFVLK